MRGFLNTPLNTFDFEPSGVAPRALAAVVFSGPEAAAAGRLFKDHDMLNLKEIRSWVENGQRRVAERRSIALFGGEPYFGSEQRVVEIDSSRESLLAWQNVERLAKFVVQDVEAFIFEQPANYGHDFQFVLERCAEVTRENRQLGCPTLVKLGIKSGDVTVLTDRCSGRQKHASDLLDHVLLDFLKWMLWVFDDRQSPLPAMPEVLMRRLNVAVDVFRNANQERAEAIAWIPQGAVVPTSIAGAINAILDGDPENALPSYQEFKALCVDILGINPPKNPGVYESSKSAARKALRDDIN